MSERVDIAPAPPPSLALVGDAIEARVARAPRRRDRAVDPGRRRLARPARGPAIARDGRGQAAAARVLPLGVRRRRRRPGRPDEWSTPGPRSSCCTPSPSCTTTSWTAPTAAGARPRSTPPRSSTHAGAEWRGEGRRFGEGVAILVGDFAFVYADMLVAALSTRRRARSSTSCASSCASASTSTSPRPRPADATQPRPAASSGTSRASTPSSGRCISARRSPAGSTSSPRRCPRSASRWARRSRCATTCSSCSATGRHRQARRRRPARRQAHAARRGRRARADATGRALLDRIGAPDLSVDEIAALQQTLIDAVRSTRSRRAHRGARRREPRRPRRTRRSPPTRRDALAELGAFVAWRDR